MFIDRYSTCDIVLHNRKFIYLNSMYYSNILRDLATIEADVTAHLEAVLRERLSKIHRERILQEQRGFDTRNTSRRSTARGALMFFSFLS